MFLSDTFFQDLRYGARMLRKSPAFASIAIGTLGLGIGAAVGIFTIVNAVLLRPLPVRDPNTLVVINAQNAKANGNSGGPFASWTKYEMLREQATAFSQLGAYVDRDVTVDPGAGPLRVRGARVTANLFDVLGVTPAIGRTFSAPDDVEGAQPVAIIADAFRKNNFNGDSDVIGKTIRIEGRDTPIIGVLPPGFRFHFSDDEPQVYLACVFTPDVMTAVQIHSGAGFLSYLGRLRPSATFEQARADLVALDARYAQEHASFVDATMFVLRANPLLEDLVGPIRPTLNILMGAVLFLLAIACANVAHLLLERAAGRRAEVGVRLALGASRTRLIRQFLTEALLLACGGSVLGVALARAIVKLLVVYAPRNIPRLVDATPDFRVLAFAVIVTLVTAAFFGIVPALRLRSVSVNESLKSGGAGRSSRSSGLQHWIAGSETAVTVVLLVAAVLLFRSLIGLEGVDPGFDPHNVTTAQITLQQSRYAEEYQREAFFTRLLQSLQAQPGMAAVGATSYLPMGGANYGFFFFIEGQPHLGVGRDPAILVRHVSPDFFRAMHIPVYQGRSFADSDFPQSQPVAIINEAAARAFFPNGNPLGQHLANSRDGLMREIVGIVGNEHFGGPASSYSPELFLPYCQVPPPSMTVVVSSSLPMETVANTIRHTVSQIDHDQAIAAIRPMEQVVASTLRQQQFTSSLLAAFAIVATTLAAIGLYGVVVLFVGQRRHEIGIRMALGAQRRDVLRLVLQHGTKVLLAGTLAGVVGAWAISRVLTGLLFGISPTEPLSYLLGSSVLLLTGIIASYVPARKATKVDPVQSLRAE